MDTGMSQRLIGIGLVFVLAPRAFQVDQEHADVICGNRRQGQGVLVALQPPEEVVEVPAIKGNGRRSVALARCFSRKPSTQYRRLSGGSCWRTVGGVTRPSESKAALTS